MEKLISVLENIKCKLQKYILFKCVFIFCFALVTAVLFETIIMFGKHISPKTPSYEIDLHTLWSPVDEIISFSNDFVHITPKAETKVGFPVDFPVESLKIKISSANIIEGTAFLHDEGYKYYYLYGNSFFLKPGNNSITTFRLTSYGKANYIMLDLNPNTSDFDIKSIVVNAEYMPFNKYRVICLALLFVLALALYLNRNVKINSSNVFVLIIIICLMSFCFASFIRYATSHNNFDFEYKKENLDNSIYCYMLDSFYKGIPYLDIEVDEKLNELINVYDRSERDFAGCTYKRDYAFFKGKYYSYYGVSPLFLVYLPYHIFTGNIPNNCTVGFILCVFCILALGFLLYEVFYFFNLEMKLPLAFFAISATFFCSLIFSIQSCSSNYLYNLSLATIFGIELVLVMVFRLYRSKTTFSYIVFSALAALSVIEIIASRPNAIIAPFLFVLPLLIKMVFDKNVKMKDKICLFVSGGTILCIGAFFICKYNYARFGSIFDFGKNYQLSAYDSNRNKFQLNIRSFINVIYYYIFELPTFSKKFPFLTLNNFPVDGQGNYLLKDPNIGLIMLPTLWFIPVFKKVKIMLTKQEGNMFLGGIIGCFLCAYIIFVWGGGAT